MKIYDASTKVFPERVWVNATAGEIFDHYVSQSEFTHITPMRESRRAKVIDYLRFNDGENVFYILAKLMKLTD